MKEITLEELAKATAQYITIQKIFDSLEPSEIQKKFAKMVEEELERLEKEESS